MGRRHLFVLLGFLAFVPSRVSCQEIISLQVKVSDSLFQLSQLPVRFRLTAPLVVKYEELDSRAEEILRFLENSGYPFAQVTIDSVSLGEFGVTGTLNIKPGELVMVDTLLNRTGFHLSPAVLSRLLGIRKGDTYREDALVSAVQRLRNIPYLTISRPLEVGFHKGKASIYLFPEKANSNRFDGWRRPR